MNDLIGEIGIIARSEAANIGAICALAAVLDVIDGYTYGHSQRVARYSLAIACNMGLSATDLRTLTLGALVHDIGKIGIPARILRKQGPLTNAEWAEMQQHVVIGEQLVLRIPFLAHTAPIVRHHHERFDGKGYPDGLRGEEIPFLARVFAVADALDAMLSVRPYRQRPLTLAEALEVVRSEAGSQFCPAAVRALLEIPVEELQRIAAAPTWPVEALVSRWWWELIEPIHGALPSLGTPPTVQPSADAPGSEASISHMGRSGSHVG